VFANIAFHQPAYAFTKPVAGALAYDIYDIGVNKLLKGPAGYVGGALLLVLGVATLISGKWPITVVAFLAGGILAKIDTIITTLGAVIT
jgi:hypothetical protein